MAAEQVEQVIFEEVSDKAPFAHELFTRMIVNTITANDFIISEIADPNLEFVDIGNVTFTAFVKAFIGPEFVEDVTAKLVFTKRGDKLHRQFTTI